MATAIEYQSKVFWGKQKFNESAYLVSKLCLDCLRTEVVANKVNLFVH